VPNQAHSGWTGDPWHACQRCGRDWHTSDLKPQKGLLVCVDCVDDLTVEERSNVIQQVLSTRPDAPPAPILEEPAWEDIEDIIV
jgi:hypothetical protein